MYNLLLIHGVLKSPVDLLEIKKTLQSGLHIAHGCHWRLLMAPFFSTTEAIKKPCNYSELACKELHSKASQLRPRA
jgi:hypothetical protein